MTFTSWTEGTLKGKIICWYDHWFEPVLYLVLGGSNCLRLWLCKIEFTWNRHSLALMVVERTNVIHIGGKHQCDAHETCKSRLYVNCILLVLYESTGFFGIHSPWTTQTNKQMINKIKLTDRENVQQRNVWSSKSRKLPAGKKYPVYSIFWRGLIF